MDKDNGANAKPSISYYLESIDGQTTAIDTLPVMPAVHDMQQGRSIPLRDSSYSRAQLT